MFSSDDKIENSSYRQVLNIFPEATGPKSGRKKTFHEKLFSDINREFPKHLQKILKSLLLQKVMQASRF